jgi:glycosyltransferase involved in cell wall biosynthesis
MLKDRFPIIIANLFEVARVYGGDLLRNRRDFDDSFFGTKYLFNRVRELALSAHSDWKADCSFQTQSIFDCSCPSVPHYIYTDHTYESCKEYPAYGKHFWAPIRNEWLIDLERNIYRNAECVFTWSRNVENILIQQYGISRRNVLCVRAGSNTSQGGLSKIRLDVHRHSSKRVLFVGREWERKGGDTLIKAFQEVRETHPDATLKIVGCNPKIREPYVSIYPDSTLEEMESHYATASLFCLPTNLEPFGIVFLEAMAAGLPIIGLRLGAAPDFIIENQTGFMVEPGDVDGLASQITHLLSNPEMCYSLGMNGRSLVVEKYTWEKTCKLMALKMTENRLSCCIGLPGS